MNYSKELFKQSSYYFISNLLATLAGFISFPIWTRVFSKAEYGIFSLIGTTIYFGIAFSKFGLQHAALRFHSDFKEKKINLDMSYYYSTLFISSLFISGLVTLSALLISNNFINNYMGKSLHGLLLVVAFLIFIGSINSILTMFIRADNKGWLYSIFSIATRYGELLAALIIVFYFMKNLYGLFLGYAFFEIIIFLALFALFIKKIYINKISFPFLKEALSYSFPLIFAELLDLILVFGDRYLIQFYMGPEAVAVYSVGYSISTMTQSILAIPLRLAIIPMYLSTWNRDGEKETKRFLKNTLNYYFMLGIPIILGLSLFGKEIVTLFATSKYQESSIIIPYIITPLILYGAYVVYGAGLYIYKRTKILMYLTLLSGIINISLNIVLIPSCGILGAAYATLISYLVAVFLIILISYKYLIVRIQIISIVKYTLLSMLVMYFISHFESKSIKELLIKIVIGSICYLFGICILEKQIRQKVLFFVKR
jgi:O-antigen/teichoic acid export membrane protein